MLQRRCIEDLVIPLAPAAAEEEDTQDKNQKGQSGPDSDPDYDTSRQIAAPGLPPRPACSLEPVEIGVGERVRLEARKICRLPTDLDHGRDSGALDSMGEILPRRGRTAEAPVRQRESKVSRYSARTRCRPQESLSGPA